MRVCVRQTQGAICTSAQPCIGTVACRTSWRLASWRSRLRASAARAFGRMMKATPWALHQYLRAGSDDCG